MEIRNTQCLKKGHAAPCTRHFIGLEAGFGFGGHVVDYGFQVIGFAEDFELAVGAGALEEHGVDVADLMAAAQIVEDVVDEGEVLEDKLADWDLFLLAEVDEFAGDAVADGLGTCSPSEGRGSTWR